jgi:hypothetical protein
VHDHGHEAHVGEAEQHVDHPVVIQVNRREQHQRRVPDLRPAEVAPRSTPPRGAGALAAGAPATGAPVISAARVRRTSRTPATSPKTAIIATPASVTGQGGAPVTDVAAALL